MFGQNNFKEIVFSVAMWMGIHQDISSDGLLCQWCWYLSSFTGVSNFTVTAKLSEFNVEDNI
jgi:hypothetical protein